LVEITGFYYEGFEYNVVAAKTHQFDQSIIWIDFNPGIDKQLANVKLNDKEIKVRGYFRAGKGGHLNQYDGSLNVCYVEYVE
jgi:hypothetical protein